MAFLMIQHLTGGTWGLVVRRFFEARTRLILLMAILSSRCRWSVSACTLDAPRRA